MNLEIAKARLCRAYAAFYSDKGFPFAESSIGKMRQEMSELSAMLNADDPAQGELLGRVIAVADELRHAERHLQAAIRKLDDAFVTVAVRQDEMKL